MSLLYWECILQTNFRQLTEILLKKTSEIFLARLGLWMISVSKINLFTSSGSLVVKGS